MFLPTPAALAVVADTVRLASDTLRVAQPLYVVVMRSGTDWYALAGLVPALGLVVLPIWFEHRRKAEVRRERERREQFVDQRVSAIASALRIQLMDWEREAPLDRVEGKSVFDAMSEIGDWFAPTSLTLSEVQRVALLRPALDWIQEVVNGAEMSEANRRFEELVAAAPEASRDASFAIKDAYEHYVLGISIWKRMILHRRRGQTIDVRDLFLGLMNVAGAAGALEGAVIQPPVWVVV